MKHSKFNLIILLLFFFSGCAALIYEVVWARKLGLVFGTTSYAISTVLVVFMAGLAIGSFLLGKVVDKLKKPKHFLLLFAFLEIGVGIYAFFTPFIFKLIEKLQFIFLNGSEISTLNINLLRFILSFLALIIPTVLMGGTLPVISKFLIRFKEEVGGKIALLYSLNTFGGVLGVVLAGFFLIITFGLGVNGAIYTAASIDTLVGLSFLGLVKRESRANEKFILGEETPNKEIAKQAPVKINNQNNTQQLSVFRYFLLFIFFFTGFTALALEVLWTRALVLTIGSSTYAFSLILAGFLTGIALGSIIVAKFVDKIKNLWLWLAVTIGLIGIFVVFLNPLFDNLPFLFIKIFSFLGESFWGLQMVLFFLIFLVLLLPTFLMGVTFPLGTKIYIRDVKKVGSFLGEIYSVNTLGCIVGSFVGGFLLLPKLGLQKSIILCSLIYFILALTLIWLSPSMWLGRSKNGERGDKMRNWGRRFLFKAIFSLIIIGVISFSYYLPQWNKYNLTSGPAVYVQLYLLSPELISGETEKENIIFYKDGLLATVSISENTKGYLAMRVNGKVDASAGKVEFKQIGDLDTMLLTGYLPLLLHPGEPKDALIVGLGSGVTLGAMTQYPLEEIDLVEIEPAIIEAAEYFKEFNHNALEDPRVKIIVEDGRNYLLISQKKYDIISSQPSNPWVKGNANLFTKEYYQLCKNNLKKDGVMFQWVQLYSLDRENLKSVIYTFSEVFPYVQVWSSPDYKDLFLIGSLQPIKINQTKFRERFNIPEIKADFEKVAISKSEEVLSHFIFTENQVKKFKEFKLHTDNYPFLEFQTPLSLYKETVSQNLEELYSFQEDIEKIFGIKLSQEAKSFQKNNLLAVIYGERGDSEQAIKYLEEALSIKSDPILENSLSKYYYGKGKLAFLSGNEEEALTFYEKAAKLNLKEPVFLNTLGAAYLRKNEFENAEIWLKKATEVGPWYTWGFSNLGLLYLKQEKLEKAESYLKKALEVNQENTDALNWLAIYYYNKGMYREAKESLEKSLKINPDQPKTKERLKELLDLRD